jgi:Bcr/CflA subfamily drug resistance transporter
MKRFSQALLACLPIFVIVYGFTGGFSNDIYLPAMPSMTRFFNTSDTMIQLTLASWGVGVGILQLFMGPWSDHYGRRPTLIYGGLIFMIGTLGCAFSNTVFQLLLFRFIQGIGTCSIFLMTMVAIKEVFSEEQRVKWLVYFNMMRSLAPLIGPVVGAYILLAYSWRGIFVVTALVGLIGLAGLLITLPETNPPDKNKVFSVKNILHDYGVALRNHYLMRHLMASAMIFGGMMVYITSGAFIMIDRLGLNEQAFSYSQVAISASYILGAACVQPGYKFIGAHRVIQTGVGLCLLASLGLLATYSNENVYLVLGCIALYSFGFGFCSTPFTERAMAHGGPRAGLVGGLIGFNISVGALAGTWITSFVPATGFYTGILMTGFAGLAALIYSRAHQAS